MENGPQLNNHICIMNFRRNEKNPFKKNVKRKKCKT